jgi:hypothetical protein
VTDVPHSLIGFIKEAWREKKVITVLFLDVKAAFLNVLTVRLAHGMHINCIPREYMEWIERKYQG